MISKTTFQVHSPITRRKCLRAKCKISGSVGNKATTHEQSKKGKLFPKSSAVFHDLSQNAILAGFEVTVLRKEHLQKNTHTHTQLFETNFWLHVPCTDFN